MSEPARLRIVAPDETAPPKGRGPRPTTTVPKPFSSEEWAALMESARPDVAAALVFLRETGMRSAEALSISAEEARSWPQERRWRRYPPVVVKITGKGRKERLVLVSADAAAAARILLSVGRPERALLFPWSSRGLRYVIAEAGKAAGVHAHPHRCRHNFATEIAEADVALEVLADMLGHSSVNTTRIYYRSSVTRRMRAMRARRRYLRRR